MITLRHNTQEALNELATRFNNNLQSASQIEEKSWKDPIIGHDEHYNGIKVTIDENEVIFLKVSETKTENNEYQCALLKYVLIDKTLKTTDMIYFTCDENDFHQLFMLSEDQFNHILNK